LAGEGLLCLSMAHGMTCMPVMASLLQSDIFCFSQPPCLPTLSIPTCPRWRRQENLPCSCLMAHSPYLSACLCLPVPNISLTGKEEKGGFCVRAGNGRRVAAVKGDRVWRRTVRCSVRSGASTRACWWCALRCRAEKRRRHGRTSATATTGAFAAADAAPPSI